MFNSAKLDSWESVLRGIEGLLITMEHRLGVAETHFASRWSGMTEQAARGGLGGFLARVALGSSRGHDEARKTAVFWAMQADFSRLTDLFSKAQEYEFKILDGESVARGLEERCERLLDRQRGLVARVARVQAACLGGTPGA